MAIHPKKGHHKKAKSSLKKEPSLQMRKSRSSPSHLVAPLNRDVHSDEDEQDSDAYQTASIQLLDLMHTMHTRAATIFNSWAEEKRWTEAAKDAIETNKVEEFYEVLHCHYLNELIVFNDYLFGRDFHNII